MRAGLLGQRNGPIGRDPAAVRILFDPLAVNARGEEVPRGTTIQWDFSDCEPWYLQLDGVVKHAVQGGSRSRPSACVCASTTSPTSSRAARSRRRSWPVGGCGRGAIRAS